MTLDDEEGTELDGLGFVDAVVAALGQSAMIPALPAWISAIAQGSDVPLEELASAPAPAALSSAPGGVLGAGVYGHEALDDSEPLSFLVECAEELAHSALAGASDVTDALGVDAGDPIEVAQADVAAQTADACAVWGTTAADPIEDAPVAPMRRRSSAPTDSIRRRRRGGESTWRGRSAGRRCCRCRPSGTTPWTPTGAPGRWSRPAGGLRLRDAS